MGRKKGKTCGQVASALSEHVLLSSFRLRPRLSEPQLEAGPLAPTHIAILTPLEAWAAKLECNCFTLCSSFIRNLTWGGGEINFLVQFIIYSSIVINPPLGGGEVPVLPPHSNTKRRYVIL